MCYDVDCQKSDCKGNSIQEQCGQGPADLFGQRKRNRFSSAALWGLLGCDSDHSFCGLSLIF